MASTALVAAAFAAADPARADGPPPDFRAARQGLEVRAAASSGRDKAEALADLIGLNVERGFYREAYGYAVLASREAPEALATTRGRDLARQAFVLSRLPQTEDTAQAMGDPASADSLFWRLAAAALAGKALPGDLAPSSEALTTLQGLASYPEKTQAELAPALLESALKGGDTDFVRALLAQLPPATRDRLLPSCQSLISGRLAELENYPKTALSRYARVTTIDDKCGAEAVLRHVMLGLDSRAMSPDAAMARLTPLLAAWRGDEIEDGALRLATSIEEKRGHGREALIYMYTLARRFPSALENSVLRERANLLATAHLTKLDGRPVEEITAERKNYLPFILSDADRRRTDLAFAERLMAERRFADAAQIYDSLISALPPAPAPKTGKPSRKPEPDAFAPERQALSLSLTAALTGAGKADAAVARLDTLPDADKPDLWTTERRNAYLRAQVALDRLDEARRVLATGMTGTETRKLAEAYMHDEKWQPAFELLSGLFGEAGTVTPQDCDRLAAAALLSGHDDEAAALLAPHRNVWAKESVMSAIAFAEASTSDGGERTPRERFASTLDSSDELIALASRLMNGQ